MGGLPAVLRNNNAIQSSPTNSPGTGDSSVSVVLTGYTGHPIIIGIAVCNSSSCLPGGGNQPVISGVTDTNGSACAQSMGASTVSGTGGAYGTDVWRCTGGSSGSDTVTVACADAGLAGCYYLIAGVAEVSAIAGTDDGIGNGSFNTSGATTINLITTGPTTAADEFVYSIGFCLNSTVEANQTSINGFDQYTIQVSSGVTPTATFGCAASARTAGSIAAFK